MRKKKIWKCLLKKMVGRRKKWSTWMRTRLYPTSIVTMLTCRVALVTILVH